ncbi:hypothetical protein [Caulobacter phage Cr30]|uniref:hypothetical protein n=1 Tax=Caulobacter phage Cr30 TaxID=1357714 RepID=UPI0004A9BB68|nr:hypothetical protein OZ74_gp232 [Caulobacter phage Cr30]AGS81111.1 hypothetical protein [Caulobacter phage Cr30]
MQNIFGFKRGEKNTGLAAIANPHAHVHIKHKKQWIGQIIPPSVFGETKWKIGLMIKDPVAHCGWRWIWFTKRFDAEDEARIWVNQQAQGILNKFDLHYMDPY